MKISTLEKTPLIDLVTVFNLSFSDYIVPVQLTINQLEQKIKADRINLKFSVGAFLNDDLVGFILNGIEVISNKKIAYNAGTGVIPSQRGKKISEKLYIYNLNVFGENSIKKIELEVITSNHFAINLYKKMGFIIEKTYNCYEGNVLKKETNSNCEIREIHLDQIVSNTSWIAYSPSWQNSIQAILAVKNDLLFFGAFCEEELNGFIVFNPISKKTVLFGTKNNKNKVEHSLFYHINKLSNTPLLITNISDDSIRANQQLISIGLQCTTKQYKMELPLLN